MSYTVRYRDFPLITVLEPHEIERLRKARENAEAKLPLLYETEVGERKYRIRGYVNDGLISGSVCEWLYNGKWLRMRNYEIMSIIKSELESKLAECQG